MGSGWEKFRYAGSFEALFDESKGGSEAGSSCSNDDSIKGMIDDGIFFEESILG